MNILQVHNHYQIPGGEDTVAENERWMLENYGHKVISYTRDNRELAEAGGIKKLKMYAESFYSLRTYREIRRILRREKIDVVHVHNTVHLISPSVFYAAMRERVPVVQTLHNFRIQCPGATFYRDGHICEECTTRGPGCALRHRCYRGSALQTAAVVISEQLQRISGIRGKIRYICLTEFNREKLLEINRNGKIIIPPEHVYVKPNFTPSGTGKAESKREIKRQWPGIDTAGQGEGVSQVLSEIDLVESKVVAERFDASTGYYVSIGRLEHIKGTHLIVKAFAHIGLPIVMIGSGEQEAQIREYLKKYDIRNIRLTGQLPHDEAMELLKNAKALVIMPQWYETFGMNVIEAYSQGVPVITNDIGNAAALVEDGITGIKCRNSVKDLEQAIRKFEGLKQRPFFDDVLKEYSEKYSEEENYKMLMEIYEKMQANLCNERD